MASVLDVAAYILKKRGSMSAMKLQKLVYYAQAWSLVWDEKRLFKAEIQAWANGPVVPMLYNQHRGMFKVSASGLGRGDPSKLNAEQRETIDAVLKFYGDKPAHALSKLTHREPPWMSARKGLKPGERGSNVITTASMAEYYDSLTQSDD